MRKLARLTALIAALVLASGAPAYARGGGGHGGGFGGGHVGGGAHAFGGGHAWGGPHGGFGGHHGFEGHHFDTHHFDHDRFHGRAFIGLGPYWDPYWDPYWPYRPYAYVPSTPTVEAPPVYIEKPQAGYCPSGQANYPGVQSCEQPWAHVAPHAG